MGCFSFFCKKSGKNIQGGEAVYLFLLKDGKVIEEMYGNYDTYGQVDGHEWKMPWNKVCDLMFGKKSGGIAAYRAEVYKGEIPTERSDDDPNQGCGRRKVKKIEEGTSYHRITTLSDVKVNYND